MELLNLFKNKKLSIDDIQFLNELLKTGMSLNDCLELLKNNKNIKIIESLQVSLDKGQLIENIITNYVSKELDVFLSPLVKKVAFNKAVDLSLSFYLESKENQKSILSSVAYPFILLFISMTALYIFDLYGLDSIFGLLTNFNTDISYYKVLRIVMRIVVFIFYFGLIFASLLVVYFSNEKRIIIFYKWLAKYFPNSIYKSYCCEELVSFLLICQRMGYKTKDSLEYLKGIIKKPILSILAFNLDESLINGLSLNEATETYWYDSLLTGYIKIASYTKDFESILESYVRISKDKIKRKIKNLASYIQTSIYLFIGLVLIFVYQILFMPMQAIGSF